MDEIKKIIRYSGLFSATLLYIDMKNYKKIACTDFVNVNLAINIFSYEGNKNFIPEFIKRMYIFCCSLTHKIRDTFIYDHIRSYSHFFHKIGHYYIFFFIK